MTQTKDNQKPTLTHFLWIIYAVFVIYATLIPFHFGSFNPTFLINIKKVSWIPFFDLNGAFVSIPDIIQNILLFMPLGFLSFVSTNKRNLSVIFVIAALCGILSICVEMLQLFSLDRITSLSDVVTNTAGGFIGGVTAFCTVLWIEKLFRYYSVTKFIQTNSFYPLCICFIIINIGSFQPFDFSLDIGIVWSKLKSLFINPFDFNLILKDEGVVFLRFFLFSSFLSICFWERNKRKETYKVVLISSIIGIGFEACQIIVKSRMPNAQDVIVILLGTLCGSMFIRYWLFLITPKVYSLLIIFMTIFTTAMQTLSPFKIHSSYKTMNLVPFLTYYERTTFVALSNFLESILMYFPLGFAFYYLSKQKKKSYCLLAIFSIVIALLIEIIQGWIDSRYPDITDVIGALAGALIGAWACGEGWKIFNAKLSEFYYE